MAVEHGTSHTPSQLALLADDWAAEFKGESAETIVAALDTHRRECSRFPSMAHVVALLPRCRVTHACAALPEGDLGGSSANWGRVRQAAQRGDVDAQKRMRDLMRRVGVAC